MGRVKLEMKKIEDVAKRKVTFAKRRNGLLKKAFELSTLCDIDIGLIMFSPSGKLTHFAKDDKIEEVIFRFANMFQHERTRRSFKTTEDLNKVVQKLHNERGLEGPRVSYTALAALQLENQELRATLNRLYQQRSFDEEEIKEEFILDPLKASRLQEIRSELEQTLDEVRERVEQPKHLEIGVEQQEVDGPSTSLCQSLHGGQALLDLNDQWEVELLHQMSSWKVGIP